MILVDSSVWVDHLRKGNTHLIKLFDAGRVLVHPFVIGEVALGRIRERKVILAALSDLPRAQVATEEKAMRVIERHGLYGRGRRRHRFSPACGRATDTRRAAMDDRSTALCRYQRAANTLAA